MVSTRLPETWRRKGEAATCGTPVNQHGAGAANSVLAAKMGAGQLHLVTQKSARCWRAFTRCSQRLSVESRFD